MKPQMQFHVAQSAIQMPWRYPLVSKNFVFVSAAAVISTLSFARLKQLLVFTEAHELCWKFFVLLFTLYPLYPPALRLSIV
jgi:hypothetical protein